MDVTQRLVIALFGPQGSGKGTQANLLAEKFSVPHFSMGNVIRREIAERTDLGIRAEPILVAGRLVPPDLFEAIARKALSGPECARGVILDGIPRSEVQMRFTEEIGPITAAILLMAPDDEVVRRLSNRRTCSVCGKIYNLISNPPLHAGECACGGSLIQRDDDTADALRQRLKIYHDETEPIIEHYRAQGKLVEIDGRKTIPAVHEEILNVLRERGIMT